jgi:hypothetical protein
MEVDGGAVCEGFCYHDGIMFGQRMLSAKRAAARNSGIRRTSRRSFGPHPGNQDEKNSCKLDILTRWNGTTRLAYRTQPKSCFRPSDFYRTTSGHRLLVIFC